MATIEQERQIRNLAKRIDRDLKKIYGEKMGMFLIVTPINVPNGTSDYISNIHREDGISTLRETAHRLETGEVIPAAKGPVQ